jgi:hypothetical protein
MDKAQVLVAHFLSVLRMFSVRATASMVSRVLSGLDAFSPGRTSRCCLNKSRTSMKALTPFRATPQPHVLREATFQLIGLDGLISFTKSMIQISYAFVGT